MRLRMVFALVTGFAFLLTVSTQDLRAAEITNQAIGDNLHVVDKAELHVTVIASTAEVAKAREDVQDFLARSEVRAQIKRIGVDPDTLSSHVALLNDSEILCLQSQVMTTDQQMRTGGMSGISIVLITILALVAIAVIGSAIAGD